MSSPTPTLVSLLLCEQILDDKITNKKSAIGLFNTILVSRVPNALQQIVVLLSLTELRAQVGLELRLVRDSDNTVLFNGTREVAAPNPLAVVDLVFILHGIRIESLGQYAFEILANGELLGRRRFQVLQRRGRRPTSGGGPGGGEPPEAPPEVGS